MNHPLNEAGTGIPPAVGGPGSAPDADRGTEWALATLVVVMLAGVGVLLGLVWHWVTPGAEVVMTSDGAVHADPGSENYFADDGWFVLLGAVVGVAAALASWILLPRCRGPVQMIGTVAGCLVAAVVAWQVGRHLGLSEFRFLLEHAAVGRHFRRPARLSALGALGVPGFTAAFTYTLLAGWSRFPSLRRPRPDAAGGWPADPAPESPTRTAPEALAHPAPPRPVRDTTPGSG